VYQRQRTGQSGAPPDFLEEIKEHHQSEEDSSRGTNLTDVGQSIAEQMAKEFENKDGTGRDESKSEAVRSPQTSINQAEAPKKESMLTDNIGDSDLAAKLDEEEKRLSIPEQSE